MPTAELIQRPAQYGYMLEAFRPTLESLASAAS